MVSAGATYRSDRLDSAAWQQPNNPKLGGSSFAWTVLFLGGRTQTGLPGFGLKDGGRTPFWTRTGTQGLDLLTNPYGLLRDQSNGFHGASGKEVLEGRFGPVLGRWTVGPGGPTVEQLLRPAGRVNFPRLALKHCTMRHGGEGGAVKGRRSRDRWDDLCSFKGMLWIGREW